MQIIEVSIIGVRSAVISLKKPNAQMQIVLFPLVHVGTPSFYSAVTARLRECQIVVAEGIQGKSTTASVLTLSYRLLPRNRRFGLVLQDLDLDSLGVQIVRPDMTAAQFESRLRQMVPITQRLMVLLLAPFLGLGMMLFGTRWILSRYMALDDDLEPVGEAFENMDKVLLDERNTLLLDALIKIHNEHSAERISVGVVYGARHVPGISRALLARLGYRPRSAEWLTVFEF